MPKGDKRKGEPAPMPPEPAPLFTKLERLDCIDDVIVARSSREGFVREGLMTKSLFMRLVIMGLTLLDKIGYLPTFTALDPLERLDDSTFAFKLGFKDQPDLFIRAKVSAEVCAFARDDLNAKLPGATIIRMQQANGRARL